MFDYLGFLRSVVGFSGTAKGLVDCHSGMLGNVLDPVWFCTFKGELGIERICYQDIIMIWGSFGFILNYLGQNRNFYILD